MHNIGLKTPVPLVFYVLRKNSKEGETELVRILNLPRAPMWLNNENKHSLSAKSMLAYL